MSDNEEIKKTPQELRAETYQANKELQTEIVISKLSSREKKAYDYYNKSGQTELSPKMQNELFNLFLAGKTTEEINSLNPTCTLGQIVHSRLKGEWDKRKEAYLLNMLNTTQSRVQQTSIESIHFIFDMLTATHKMYGEKVKRYIQTGKESDLEGFSVGNLTHYAKCIDMLQKLSSQAHSKTINNKEEIVLNSKEIIDIIEENNTNAEKPEDILKRLLESENK